MICFDLLCFALRGRIGMHTLRAVATALSQSQALYILPSPSASPSSFPASCPFDSMSLSFRVSLHFSLFPRWICITFLHLAGWSVERTGVRVPVFTRSLDSLSGRHVFFFGRQDSRGRVCPFPLSLSHCLVLASATCTFLVESLLCPLLVSSAVVYVL